MDLGNDKANRVLSLYSKLMNGSMVYKSEEANRFQVNERTIQRDIDDIRNFLEEEIALQGITNEVVYDRIKKGGVTDYFVIKGIPKIIFNLSDIVIILGAVISVIGELVGNDE